MHVGGGGGGAVGGGEAGGVVPGVLQMHRKITQLQRLWIHADAVIVYKANMPLHFLSSFFVLCPPLNFLPLLLSFPFLFFFFLLSPVTSSLAFSSCLAVFNPFRRAILTSPFLFGFGPTDVKPLAPLRGESFRHKTHIKQSGWWIMDTMWNFIVSL